MVSLAQDILPFAIQLVDCGAPVLNVGHAYIPLQDRRQPVCTAFSLATDHAARNIDDYEGCFIVT
jgi:hypothetical protein